MLGSQLCKTPLRCTLIQKEKKTRQSIEMMSGSLYRAGSYSFSPHKLILKFPIRVLKLYAWQVKVYTNIWSFQYLPYKGQFSSPEKRVTCQQGLVWLTWLPCEVQADSTLWGPMAETRLNVGEVAASVFLSQEKVLRPLYQGSTIVQR